jgi:hypothetical protein
MCFPGQHHYIFALQELQFQDAKQCAEATFKQRCLSVDMLDLVPESG